MPTARPAGVESDQLTTPHGGRPWAQAAPTAGEQVKRANTAVAAFAAAQDFEYSLFEADSNELVGGLRLNRLLAPGTAEIGYWVRSDRHRRGYATQAVRLATDAAFNHLEPLLKVEIHMDPANEPSRRVAQKAGYLFDCEIDRLARGSASGRATMSG